MIDSCAGDDRAPFTEGHASLVRVWATSEGKLWRITVTIDVEPADAPPHRETTR